jgi:hypothetical protein
MIVTTVDRTREWRLDDAGYRILGKCLSAAEANGEHWHRVLASRTSAMIGCLACAAHDFVKEGLILVPRGLDAGLRELLGLGLIEASICSPSRNRSWPSRGLPARKTRHLLNVVVTKSPWQTIVLPQASAIRRGAGRCSMPRSWYQETCHTPGRREAARDIGGTPTIIVSPSRGVRCDHGRPRR